jgi:dephospho-CoA kinase
MIVIGLTGSIAMGKSEVAKIFEAEGIPVFDADAEVHRFYESQKGADLIAPLAPTGIRDGRVDRQALTDLITEDSSLLAKLEAIVHAEIARRRQVFLHGAKAQGHLMAALNIPLLFEKGTESNCDVTLVVSSPPQDQKRRVLARKGMTEERLKLILNRQMPDAEKRAKADFVIENDGSLSDLKTKTLMILKTIRERHQH